MEEKQWPELTLAQSARRGATAKNRLKTAVLGTLLCLAVHVYWQPTYPLEHRPRRLTYPGEHIEWDPCGEIEGHRLECSEIDVPMDQFDKENRSDKTFNIPLIRMRGHNATKNLLVNPGGPGGSGVRWLYGRGKYLNAVVGDEFHLLSFDPRGVNSSRPAALCYPDKETRNRLFEVHVRDPVADSAELFARTSNNVRACSDTAGEHGKYVNTPQSAADMNSILDAVGQENLFYWGFSYGTILGQTYATLYPDRSERVIIDGVGNQFNWYGVGNTTEHLHDTESVLRGFFDECIKAKSNCSLTDVADSAEDLLGIVDALSDRLQEEPISVYLNNTRYGTFGHRDLWYGAIFPSLYYPASWFELADRLSKLLHGNATEAFLAYAGDPFLFEDESNTFVMLNDALSGSEFWPQDRHELLEEILPFLNKSIFAPFEASGFYGRQQWLVPRTHQYVPSKRVKTSHPLLIMSMSYDPVCPLISAQSARDTFEGSRIVEVKGYGHCSTAMPSTCAERHIRDYLHEGKLPLTDTQCETEGSYFARPDKQAMGSSRLALDSEDLSQVALPRNMQWPFASFF